MCTILGYGLPERETFRMLPLISFCILTFCKNRTFRFTPVICKDCTILAENGITILAALWSALKLNKSQTYNSTLSCIPTYSILHSTTSQQRPGCQSYGNQRFHNSMDLQPMTTSPCRHSPSLHYGKCAARFPSHRHRVFYFPPSLIVPLSRERILVRLPPSVHLHFDECHFI